MVNRARIMSRTAGPIVISEGTKLNTLRVWFCMQVNSELLHGWSYGVREGDFYPFHEHCDVIRVGQVVGVDVRVNEWVGRSEANEALTLGAEEDGQGGVSVSVGELLIDRVPHVVTDPLKK